jgi:hypothetical protein
MKGNKRILIRENLTTVDILKPVDKFGLTSDKSKGQFRARPA